MKALAKKLVFKNRFVDICINVMIAVNSKPPQLNKVETIIKIIERKGFFSLNQTKHFFKKMNIFAFKELNNSI